MTTCAECLTALSTMRLAEIGESSPIRQHYATCPNCSRVAQDLQYAEHKLALALSEMGSPFPPEVIAQDAITGSERLRRRTTARWIRRGLAFLAGLLLTGYIVRERAINPGNPEVITRTVVMKCGSPDDAMEIVTPYLRSHGAAVYKATNAKVITIRGIESEVAQALAQIDALDARFCALPTPAPSVTQPGGTPGKD